VCRAGAAGSGPPPRSSGGGPLQVHRRLADECTGIRDERLPSFVVGRDTHQPSDPLIETWYIV